MIVPIVPTNGIETYYVTWGDGPPIVFIHGMIMSTSMWEPQMDALRDTFTTIAYDVRGHGRTGGSNRRTYSIELFAEDLKALLDALDVDRTVICGLSMGGTIAQTFAAVHPEKVAGLVLADTFPSGSLPFAWRIALVNIRILARLDRFIDYGTLNRWQLKIGNLLVPGVSRDEEAIQRLVENAPAISHAEFVKIADAVARFPKQDVDLGGVTAPTLVLHGEYLPTSNEKSTERLVAALRHADTLVQVVPESGHVSNLDNPEFFTSTLREFLLDHVYPEATDAVGG